MKWFYKLFLILGFLCIVLFVGYFLFLMVYDSLFAPLPTHTPVPTPTPVIHEFPKFDFSRLTPLPKSEPTPTPYRPDPSDPYYEIWLEQNEPEPDPDAWTYTHAYDVYMEEYGDNYDPDDAYEYVMNAYG